MKFRLLFFLFIFIIYASKANYTDSLLKGMDTLVFYFDKTQNFTKKEDVENIFKSNDKLKIAELFNKTAIHYINSSQEQKSIGYFVVACRYFEELNEAKALALCYNYLGAAYYLTDNFEKSLQYYSKSIKLNLSEKNISATIETLEDLGFIYLNTFRYTNSIQTFEKALEIAKQNNDTSSIARQYYYIGNVYKEDEKIDSSLKYYTLSLQYDILKNDKENILASYNNIGVLFYNKYNFKTAQNYLNIADTMIYSLKTEMAKAILLNNIANISYNQQNYNDALKKYNQSLKIKKQLLSNDGIALTEYNIGKLYSSIDNTDSAIYYLTNSLKLATEINNKDIIARSNLVLSEIYEKLGEIEKAYNYYKDFAISKYSIIGDDLGKQITEYTDESYKKRNERASLQKEIQMQKLFSDYNIDIQDKEIRILEERKKYQNNINLGFGILFFIVILIIYISYKRNKERKKNNILLNAQNEEIAKQTLLLEEQAEKLIESNKELEKLSIVARETDNAVLIMDKNGNFEWINDAFTRITGYTFHELVNNISNNIISDNTPDYIKERFSYCIANKKTVHYDFQTTSKSGEILWLTVTLTPILNDKAEINKLVSIDSDITQLKLAEAEIFQQKEEIETQKEELEDQRDYLLEQKDELKKHKEELEATLLKLKNTQKKLVESEKMAALGNLVAGVSHEINTPIGIGIAASSSMATKTSKILEMFEAKKMKMSDLEQYLEQTQQVCELILSNLNRTAELVTSFKQVSVDNMTENKRTFKFKDYINDIIRSLAPKIKHRPITINIECDSDLSITSYPGAFAQIFTNFIINSLLHAFEENQEGNISIMAKMENKNLLIEYKDNGKGIPQENISKIFDPFFTTNMQSGTGLGMNITYNLITQKLKGEISLQSKEGNGVTFTISIPNKELK